MEKCKRLNSLLLKYLIGPYIGTFIAYSTDAGLRYRSASGGVARVLLGYALEEGHVEAVLLPKLRFKRGLAYGVWSVVRDPKEIYEHPGSIYAPTFGFSNIITHALNEFKRIAMTALPCQAKAVRKLMSLQKTGKAVLIVGLYCNNTPHALATKYALKTFGIRVEDVESISYRGDGWPGHVRVKTKTRRIRIPLPLFWGSGFGQYFYGRGCRLCSDQTNSFADLSLADPWTLPHEPVRGLGGATLVLVRTRKGLEVFEGALRAGYVEAIEVDPIYAVQDAMLLKLSKRVLKRRVEGYVLPPGFTTIAHELVYHVGCFLASREPLWPLLRLYHRVVAPLVFKVASLLDYRLKTKWAKVYTYVKLLQKIKVPREGIFAEKTPIHQ